MAAAVHARPPKSGLIMTIKTIARLPQAFFAGSVSDAGPLFGGASSLPAEDQERFVKNIRMGIYTLRWHYSRRLTMRHISILMALLRNMIPDQNNDLPLTFADGPAMTSGERLDAVVKLWDGLQRRAGIWQGSMRELLIASNLSTTQPDNYKTAYEFLFDLTADNKPAGLDIQVSIEGGGIKHCRPVSIFKSSVAVDGKISVKLNWFFAAAAFADFKEIAKEEARVLKYTPVDMEKYFDVDTNGGWLYRSVYLWLNFLTNGFRSGVSLEWNRFEALVYGYKKRTKRQVYDNLRRLKDAVIHVFVNYIELVGWESKYPDAKMIEEWISDPNKFTIPPFKLKRVTPPRQLVEPGQKFEEFWRIYPACERKNARSACLKVWADMELDPIADEIFSALRRQKQSRDWEAAPDKYIPAPINWLRRRTWER